MWWRSPHCKWEEVKDGESCLNLKDLDGSKRLIFEVNSKSVGRFYIATDDNDIKGLLGKHKCPVLPASKIIKFFSRECDEETLTDVFPKIAIAVNELNAKII